MISSNLCFDRGYGLIRSGFVPWGKRVYHKDHHKSNLRFGGVLAISDYFLGDFPRVLATWYHFSGNFHRYVLSFRLGVPIPDPFLEDAAMASPKRRAGAVFGVGNTSQVYQPYTNIVALFTGYKSVLYRAQTPMASMCSIRRPCGFRNFDFTPDEEHARHGRSCD